MSVITQILERLTALETGGSLAQRLAAIEEVLGLTPEAAPETHTATGTIHCDRCGMDKPTDETFRCNQAKCPIAP